MSTRLAAMVLAGGKGTRLQSLTKKVAKPAVSYGGKYRIIDFPLSNCANSGITSVGVSIENHSQDVNLGAVRKILPSLLGHILEYPPKPGVYLNINFPDIPFENIKGCTMASQGTGIWIKEFIRLEPEECVTTAPEDGMEVFKMLGDYEDSAENLPTADNRLMAKGYVTIVPHSIDYTDYNEMKRLAETWNL